MGYYTQYSIVYDTHTITPEMSKKIEEFFENVDGGGWEYYGDQIWGDGRKWYDQELDMYRISKAFPEVLFTVSGDGEYSDDVWEEHWQDGSMQHCHMVIPPYDPEKMVKLALDAEGSLITDLSEDLSQDSSDSDIDIGEVL